MGGCLKVILSSGGSSAVQRGYGRYGWRDFTFNAKLFPVEEILFLTKLRAVFWVKALSGVEIQEATFEAILSVNSPNITTNQSALLYLYLYLQVDWCRQWIQTPQSHHSEFVKHGSRRHHFISIGKSIFPCLALHS
ncbi:hypothetical protein Goari_027191 [Gossypium aridum]|uniref:Uncharacterized protein n=1 Tax=Gossypium aridum TaxID=34290 RepID=A0A7J8YT65_GOSAI|nr:hypothetical protein [Gossypium aridum]